MLNGLRRLWFVVGLLVFLMATQAQATLNFWKFSAPLDDEIIQKYVNEWNNTHPDMIVAFNPMPWGEYVGVGLASAFAAGAGPDIFWLSPGDILRYVNAGVLVAFDDYLTKEELEDLLPTARQRGTIAGHIYGLPVEIEPLAILYNAELFDEYGIEAPPKSWTELVDIARKLTTSERWGLIIETSADFYQLFTWYPWLWSAGGDVMDSEWNEATIDTEAGVAALQFWADLVNTYKVSPPSVPVPTHQVTPLYSGMGAMQICGMWAVGALESEAPDFKWGVFPIPPRQAGGSSVTVFGGWTFVVNADSSNVDAAIAFCKWIIFESDFLKEFCVDRRSKIPSRVSVLEAGKAQYYTHPAAAVFIDEILPTARPEPRYPPSIQQVLLDALQGVMFGGVAPEEAAQVADYQIDLILKSYGGYCGAYEPVE